MNKICINRTKSKIELQCVPVPGATTQPSQARHKCALLSYFCELLGGGDTQDPCSQKGGEPHQ